MPRVADKFHPRCPCPLLGESPINGTHHARAVIGRWRPVKILATCPFDALIEIRLQLSRLERPQTRLQNHRKPKQVGKEKVCKTPHNCTKGPDQSTEHPPHCKASFYNVSSVKTVSKTLETDTVSVRKPKTTKTQRKPDSKKLRKKSWPQPKTPDPTPQIVFFDILSMERKKLETLEIPGRGKPFGKPDPPAKKNALQMCVCAFLGGTLSPCQPSSNLSFSLSDCQPMKGVGKRKHGTCVSSSTPAPSGWLRTSSIDLATSTQQFWNRWQGQHS